MYHLKRCWVSPNGIMAKVVDCDLEVNAFKLQLCYYVHFQINTFWKSMSPLILPNSYVLNYITTVLQ